MGNTLRAEVSVEGTRPLLWHHFGPDAIPTDKRKERTGVAGNDPEEWRRTVLVTRRGQLYLEPAYVFAAIRDAARYTKRGRASIQSAVSATLQVTDDLVLIDRHFPGFPNGHEFDSKTVEPPAVDPTLPVYMDVRSVKNPSTKGRNVRYRVAACPGWRAKFSLAWDKTIVSRGEMEAVMNDAGQFAGLADGRSIGFGRFRVERFEAAET
ncbi:MAG: hypothetical protein ACJ754_01635 [Pyrinomonadaceae bacterium]